MRANRYSMLKQIFNSFAVTIVMAVLVSGPVQAQLAPVDVVTDETKRTSLLESKSDDQLDEIRGALKPFGHSLFSGGFGVSENGGLNGNYIVTTGDRISVRIWGAIAFESVQVVDTCLLYTSPSPRDS